MGDRVLSEASDVLRRNMRAADIVARIGGEEFALMMPDSQANTANATAQRLCDAIAATPITAAGLPAPIDVTVSIGVVSAQPNETLAALTERADRALYRAKEAGRNMVMPATTVAA